MKIRKLHNALTFLLAAAAGTFVLTVFSPFCPMILKAAEPEEGSGNVGENDKYIISMEWGEMNFVYDYGRWNPSTFTYDADASSEDPAAGTEQGKPGWYGFDGVSNRIFIQDSSLTTEGEGTVFTVETEMQVSGVLPSWYTDEGLSTPLEGSDGKWRFELFNDREDPVDADRQKEIFLSLSGEPASRADGTDGKFEAENAPVQIGSITVTVQTKKEAWESS